MNGDLSKPQSYLCHSKVSNQGVLFHGLPITGLQRGVVGETRVAFLSAPIRRGFQQVFPPSSGHLVSRGVPRGATRGQSDGVVGQEGGIPGPSL